MTDKSMTIGEYFLSTLCPADFSVVIDGADVSIADLLDIDKPNYPCGECAIWDGGRYSYNCPIWQMDISELKGVKG